MWWREMQWLDYYHGVAENTSSKQAKCISFTLYKFINNFYTFSMRFVLLRNLSLAKIS